MRFRWISAGLVLTFASILAAQTPGEKVDETRADVQYYYNTPRNQILVDPVTHQVYLAYTWSANADSMWSARINNLTDGSITDLPIPLAFMAGEEKGMGTPDIRMSPEGNLYSAASSGAIAWFYYGNWADGLYLYYEETPGNFVDIYKFDEHPYTGHNDPNVNLCGWHLIDDDGTIHYLAYDGWGFGASYKRSVDGGLTFTPAMAFGSGQPQPQFQSIAFPTWGENSPLVIGYSSRPYGYTMASNGKGKVAIISTDQGANVWMIESFDGGATWPDEPTNVTQYGETFGGTDQARPHRFLDAMYDKQDELHIVWEACYFLNETQKSARHPWPGNGPDEPYLKDYKDRLMHWSATAGITTVAISKAAETNLDDRYRMLSGRGTNCLVSGPTLAYDEANDVIYVGYTQFTEADADTIPAADDPYEAGINRYLGYGDLYVVSTADGGQSWGEAVNITATPGFDERYMVLNDEVVDGKVHIFYIGDESPGNEYFAYLPPVTSGVYYYAYDPSPTAVDGADSGVEDFRLTQNYPNPFNPVTEIQFSTPRSMPVKLSVFNAMGQRVKVLVDEVLTAGSARILWDGTDEAGMTVANGVYFYRISAGDFSETKKMVFMK